MENFNDECRTEILVDLKEVGSELFHRNRLKIKESVNYQKSVKYFENEENDMCEKGQEKYECILDMSPLRLKNGCRDRVKSLNINSDEVLKGCAYDCPTAVLIDVPYNSNLSPKQYSFIYENNHFPQENKSCKSDNLSEGVARQANVHAFEKEYSAIKDSKDPHDLIAEKNEVSPPRLRWKTPSPQSMSRISKEASKVILNLNSSTFFKEDISLCEEILPIPISFDNFDLDDNSDEDLTSSSENFSEDNVSKSKLSVCIQTEDGKDCSKAVNKVSGICSSTAEDNLKNSSNQKSSTQLSTEQNDSDMSYESHDSYKSDFSSKELKSSDIQSDSPSNYEISSCKEGSDEVFIKSSILSEDKENIQGREHKKNTSSEKLVSNKTSQKNLSSKMKLQNRDTLRNLSNIKHAIDTKNLTYTSKKNALSHLKQYNEVKVKEFLTPQKQQLKKTTLMQPQTEPKKVCRSSSLQYKGRRESICSFQEPRSVNQKACVPSTSVYKSSSSDDKHVYPQLKTPSRRYSIATPLKSASVKKPSLTPAPSSFQNPSVSRFTPQPVKNRLSFSKSWQQSSNVSNLKGFKFQNSTHASSAVPKPSFGMYSSKAVNKMDLSQTISSFSQIPGKNAVSTSSKKRVCSKLSLPSPLPVEQDRKFVRALFPSFPPK